MQPSYNSQNQTTSFSSVRNPILFWSILERMSSFLTKFNVAGSALDFTFSIVSWPKSSIIFVNLEHQSFTSNFNLIIRVVQVGRSGLFNMRVLETISKCTTRNRDNRTGLLSAATSQAQLACLHRRIWGKITGMAVFYWQAEINVCSWQIYWYSTG